MGAAHHVLILPRKDEGTQKNRHDSGVTATRMQRRTRLETNVPA